MPSAMRALAGCAPVARLPRFPPRRSRPAVAPEPSPQLALSRMPNARQRASGARGGAFLKSIPLAAATPHGSDGIGHNLLSSGRGFRELLPASQQGGNFNGRQWLAFGLRLHPRNASKPSSPTSSNAAKRPPSRKAL